MMNEWGVPDWRDATAYVGEPDWHLARWKWEFLRRRSDLRIEFDNKKAAAYEQDEAWTQIDDTVPLSEYPSPEMAGFCVSTFLIEPDFPAPTRLPNPRIGNQPPDCLPRLKDGTLTKVAKRDLPFDSGFYRVDFDLSRPIEPQLKAAKSALKSFQKEYAGKVIGKRRHPEKWPTYLRVLDARDAGASWAEVSEILTYSAATEQNARDIHMQALALCFNF